MEEWMKYVLNKNSSFPQVCIPGCIPPAAVAIWGKGWGSAWDNLHPTLADNPPLGRQPPIKHPRAPLYHNTHLYHNSPVDRMNGTSLCKHYFSRYAVVILTSFFISWAIPEETERLVERLAVYTLAHCHPDVFIHELFQSLDVLWNSSSQFTVVASCLVTYWTLWILIEHHYGHLSNKPLYHR